LDEKGRNFHKKNRYNREVLKSKIWKSYDARTRKKVESTWGKLTNFDEVDKWVKFECNDMYHCIRKTILNGDDLSV